MSSPNENWYSHLVAQSRTDAIYTLIHSYLMHDWAPNHDLDFVTVRRKNLPANLKEMPAKDVSQKLSAENYCFPGDDYVLLDNYQLIEYLHAAEWAKHIEDFENRSFIELFFEKTEESKDFFNNTPAYAHSKRPTPKKKIGLSQYEQKLWFNKKEKYLIAAYKLLQTGEHKKTALQYAEKGKAFLDRNRIAVNENTAGVLQQVARRMMGYNIVSMVYAWNDQINKASEVDKTYIHHPAIWADLFDCIRSYLELLMIKNQQDYLHYLFTDKEFRKFFLSHYEAFISLFVDDTYKFTFGGEVMQIINRVRNDITYK